MSRFAAFRRWQAPVADEERVTAGSVPPGGDDTRAGGGPVSRSVVFGWAVAATAGVVAVFVAATTLYVVRSVVIQAVIGLFLALSLDPPVRWMVRRGTKRGHAVAAIFLGALTLAAVFLWVFMPPLVREGASLTSDFPGYLAHLRQRSPGLAHLDARFHLQSRLNDWIAGLPAQARRNAWTVGQRFLGAVASTLLVGVLTIYFMLDLPRLRSGLVSLFPHQRRQQVDAIIAVVTDKVGSYMIGNILISGIAGVCAAIALALLKVPFALPLALVVALTDLLPMIGATLGAAVCVVAALATTNLWPNTVLVVLFFVFYQQLENYVIAPRVLRNAVELPPLAVLLAALIGGNLLGLVGALMAIPAAAVIKSVTAPALRTRDTAPPAPAPPPDSGVTGADRPPRRLPARLPRRRRVRHERV